LFSLNLIIWAGVATWQCPGREGAGISHVGSPACPSLPLDLEPLLVALGFWAIGLVMWFASQRGPTVEFFLVGAGALPAGLLSAMGSDGGGRLFYLLLAWLAPLTFHFHYALLNRPPRRVGRIVLGALYSLAAAWSPPFLFWTITALQQRGWFIALRAGVRLSLATAFVLVMLLLLRDYGRQASAATRRRIRLVTFGTLSAFMPMLLLSLLPDTLGAPAHVPYELTFPWLLLSPLAYGYSLFRHRLIKAEVALNRAAVYYLLVTLLLGIYLAAAALLNRLTTSPASYWPLGSAMLSVGLLLLFVPLRRGLQWLMTWILYGSEISYAGVVGRLAESLALTLDRETLRCLLTDELVSAMRLSRIALFLKEDNTLVLLGTVGFEPGSLADDRLPGDGRLAAYLEAATGPAADAQVRRALARATLNEEERALLSLMGIAFWLPLVSSGVLQGVLLIGSRSEDDSFTAEDEHILATLAHQSGIAAHNVRLMEQVEAARQELARAHQQLLVGREQEQRRLAQELHDNALQQLLNINRELGVLWRTGSSRQALDARRVQAPTPDVIRQELLDVVAQLRGLVSELRPAGLEELGLTNALQGYVARLVREGGSAMPKIELNMDQVGTSLPQPVAICLFRAGQEALRNVLKHAQAQHITLNLRLLPGEVALSVRDDGCGFRVPARLSELTRADHFGLVGIAERVSLIGGQLTLRSQPRLGTEVAVQIPLVSDEELALNSAGERKTNDKGMGQDNGRDDSSSAGR
jgi:signal transduction histidine kinase